MSTSRLALYLLGPSRVELDGAEIRIPRRKTVALLAYLAVTGRSHRRDSLATLLFPEYDQSRALAYLRRILWVLNTTLGGEWLAVDREAAGLNPDADLWLDVRQFRQWLAACEAHAHPAVEVCPDCASLLEEAAALYRDHFMAGFTLPDCPAFDEFQLYQTEGLKDELAGVLVRLATYRASQGDFETAMGYARRWLALDPLHEPAHRHLMLLYAQAGRHSAAVRQYRTCLRALEQELDLPPSAETTALYERIRAERARLMEREMAAPAGPPPIAAPLPAFLAQEEAPGAVERPVFVARERELGRLDGYLDAALSGQGQVAFVTGGPGRGKTALMGAFARRAMAAYDDLQVVIGRCNAYSGVGDPYLPFREVLGMLTGDVETRWAAGTISGGHARRLWGGLGRAARALVDRGPSLIGTLVPGGPLLSRATAVAPQGAGWLGELRTLSEGEGMGHSGLEQRAMFEQYTNVLRALAAQSPLLLLLDDLQWADAASTGLLFHLGRRLEGARILVLGAYRPEEVALGRDGERHPLDKALAEFKQGSGDVWIDLSRADETEGRRFVDAFLDIEAKRLGEPFREALFRHTGGHPLFTVEVLRAMQERGDLVRDEQGWWTEGPDLDWDRLPARVEAVIAERVGRLDQELHDILAVASVEGERFTAQVVARVQDAPERAVLRALSQELQVRHRLVWEQEEVRIDHRFLSGYRFAHALFQQYLYDRLGAGERRLLHGEVGMALEGLYGGRTEDVVAQLAHHYDEAGDTEKAIEYALRAGDQARLAYAHQEATAQFNRALTLLDESTPGESRQDRRFAALKGLGQTYFAAGELAQAEESLQAAIAQGRELGLAPRELVRLYHYLAEILWWQDRYEDQIRVGEEGLALLGDDTESVEAVLMNDMIAWGHWSTGNMQKSSEILHRNAHFIQRLPYSPQLTNAQFHIFNLFAFHDRDVEEVVKWWRFMEEKAAPHTDLWSLIVPHGIAGNTLRVMGNLQESTSRTRQAAEMFTRIGDTKHECLWLHLTAEAFLSLGDLENAEEYADRAFEIAEAIGLKLGVALCYCYDDIGVIALCQGNWGKAVGASEKALQIHTEMGRSLRMAWAQNLLGRAYLAQGEQDESLRRFQEAVTVAGPEVWKGDVAVPFECLSPNPLIANTLSGLEAAYDDSDAFRAFCHRFREHHVEAGDGSFVQWFLEPVGAVGPGLQGSEPPLHHDVFAAPVSPDWVWVDQFGDCSFTVGDGLEIHAPNGRGLWHVNLSAPRVVRSVSGSWSVQTVCTPVPVPASGTSNPTIGGLLLWKDKDNFLRLDRGASGEQDVFFGGYLENQAVVIGRGRLPSQDANGMSLRSAPEGETRDRTPELVRGGPQQVENSVSGWGEPSGRVFLRLERSGDRVDAYCSADGEDWFTVGYVKFPVEDPLQIGLHAIGDIDRSVYHGAYPDGTAIRFESFQLWGT